MILRLSFVLGLFFLSAAAYAADLETIIVAPSGLVQAGKTVEIEVYFINPTDHMIRAEAQDPLKGRLNSGENTF